ncbi:hypothetical protein [Amycolatopsis methanolica]|uniref:Uncharacterized protein n=1 Tax=Amycolatopsis methanolica 239 TaxID=1068978 RepID=A0A076MUB1_AMYME|nr:hypothetical protein [Amycolatopsis methanolica]AIJ24344.1 hypothetical protein AMETH_4252 [Amycolatopsis methanolica 239]
MATVHEVRLRHESDLMSIPEVVAVGDAEDEENPVIKVFVTQPPRDTGVIPDRLEGYPVEIIVAGTITAQN